MPKVNIDVNSKYNAQDTFQKIKGLFGDDSEVKKFDSSLTCDFDEANHTCNAKGSKFSATLQVKPSSNSSTVSVVVDLPMLLSPFKGQVKSTVEKRLNSLLS